MQASGSSRSLSESNPLSNLGFDELLALADAAWAHSDALPGNDHGFKPHCIDDPLTNLTNKLHSHHHPSLEQHSIIHDNSNYPQEASDSACYTKRTSQDRPDNAIKAESRQLVSMQINMGEKDPGGEEKNVPAKQLDNNGTPPNKELCNPVIEFAAVSSTFKENHNLHKGSSHDTDLNLNKTLQQKSKRRKHCHKVIIEGKPVTPKPNPTAKRKYVRRKGWNKSFTPPTQVTGELTKEMMPGFARTSCRRPLHFDKGVRDESSTDKENAIVHLSKEIGVVAQEMNEGLAYDLNTSMKQAPNNYMPFPNEQAPSTSPSRRDPAGAKENTTGKRKYLRRKGLNKTSVPTEMTGELTEPIMPESTIISCGRSINFDRGVRDESNTCGESLACHQSTLVKESSYNYLSLPENEKSPRTSLSESNPPGAKLNANTVENKDKRKGLATAQDGNISNSQISKIRLQMVGSKRKHSGTIKHADNSSMNLIGAQYYGLSSYQKEFWVQFPNIQKKRTTEKGKTSNTHITSSVTTKEVQLTCPQEDAQAHPYASNSSCWIYASGYNAAIVPATSESTENVVHNTQTFDEFILSLRRLTERSKSPTLTCDCGSIARIRNHNTGPNCAAKQLAILDRQTFGDAERPQACMDALVAETHVSLTKKKQNRKRSVLSSSAYSSTNEMQRHLHFALGNPHLPLGVPLDIAREAMWKAVHDVEALAEQFRQLSISTEAKDLALHEQNALIARMHVVQVASDNACTKRTSQDTPDNAIKAQSRPLLSMQINMEEKDPGGEEKNVPAKKLDNHGTTPNKELCDPVIEFAAVSSTFKENHNPDKGSSHATDLSKTPEQKPKRKKHRLNVRRKYVRRKGDTPPTEVTGEFTKEMPESAKMSCQRSLNFDIEARDKSSAGIENAAALLGKENGVVIQETNVGLAFDLNTPISQASNSYVSLPEDTQAPNTSASRKNGPGAKLKENPTAKRKYVRRKGFNISSTPPKVTGELTKEIMPESAITSCRRSLHLDKGMRDESSADKENAIVSNEIGVVAQEMNEGLAYDPNTSMKQAPNNYMPFPSREDPLGAKPKENQTGKRKYMRKKELSKCTITTEMAGELTEAMMPESKKMSWRFLNFDIGTTDGSSAGRENLDMHISKENNVVAKEKPVGFSYDIDSWMKLSLN